MSRTEHSQNFCSFAKFIKFPYQQVVIHPQRTPDDGVTPVLLWRPELIFITCNVKRIFLAVVLKDFITTPCTDLQTWQFLIRWKEYLMELLNIQFSSIVHLWSWAENWSQQQHSYWNVDIQLATLWTWLLHIIWISCSYMVSEIRVISRQVLI